MERRVAVRAIIIHDGKFLAVKLKSYTGALQGNYWCTIGGTVEAGEALLPALEREVFEETGVKPIIGKLLYVQQFNDDVKEHLEFFFLIKNGEDFLTLDISNSSHGAKEIKEIAFVNPDKEHILPAFLKEQNYKNLDSQETIFFNNLK